MEVLDDEEPHTPGPLEPVGKAAARRRSSLGVAAVDTETEQYGFRRAGRAPVGRVPAPLPAEESDPLPGWLEDLPKRLAAGGAALGVVVVAEAAAEAAPLPADRPPVE